ncbi:hypothetical protein [Aliiroseovarius sp. 2305UL8-7]|uniref:hypothetical protein n=1 Tax=Aliiroseovarius conchicola TaxID=3121637 RepID=UPI00352916AD
MGKDISVETFDSALDSMDSITSADELFRILGIFHDRIAAETTLVAQGVGIVGEAIDTIVAVTEAYTDNATVLKNVQDAIEEQTKAISDSNHFKAIEKDLPTPNAVRIQSETLDIVLGEYSRVDAVIESQLSEVENEISKISSDREQLKGLLAASEASEQAGLEVEKLFQDLSQTKLVEITDAISFSVFDQIAHEMNAVINMSLSARTEAIISALGRVDEQLSHLKEHRVKLQRQEAWMDVMWTYEILRAMSLSKEPAIQEALDKALDMIELLPDKHVASVVGHSITVKIRNQKVRTEVFHLMRDAAKSVKEAARHAATMKVLSLIHSGVSLYSDISNSAAGSDTKTIKKGDAKNPTETKAIQKDGQKKPEKRRSSFFILTPK